MDNRSSKRTVVTHNGLHYNAYSIHATDSGILRLPKPVQQERIEVIGVDEVQFLPDAIVALQVIACGLNLNFTAEPFMNTILLAAKADTVRYLSAVCVVCCAETTRTQRVIGGRPASGDSPTIVVGRKELYESRCRKCFEPRT